MVNTNNIKTKDKRIAIIGAGISGLTAAHNLKKMGYKDIVIYESEDQVGGKISTVEMQGLLYELGALFLLGGSKTIEGLAKEYRVPLSKKLQSGMVYINGKQVSQFKFMRSYYNLFKILHGFFILSKIVVKEKRFDTPGFFDISPDLFINLKSYYTSMKMDSLTPISDAMVKSFACGSIEKTPAFYLIKMFKSGFPFLIKQQLNSTLGLKLNTMKMFDKGYQNLLEEIAKNFEVRLNSRVTGVSREVSSKSTKIQISTERGSEIFDRIIISSLPVHTLKYLDAKNSEKEILEKVKYTYFHEIMFEGDVKLKGDALFYRSESPGANGNYITINQMHPDRNIYQTHQAYDDSTTQEKLDQNIKDMVDELGGRMDKIILKKTFTYFPHFTEEDFIGKNPYDQLEQIQGHKGTYFIGSLMNFEGTEQTASYAQYLVNKHF